MSKVIGNGLRATQRSLADELKDTRKQIRDLQEAMQALAEGVSKRVQSLGDGLNNHAEILNALRTLNGAAEVDAVLDEMRVGRMTEEMEREKASLEAGIKDGFVVSAAAIGEKSLIVGRYLSPTNEPVAPGRVQLTIPKVDPKFRELLLSKAAGHKLDLPEQHSFEVLEIYEIDEAKYNEVAAAKAAEAESAAAAAAAADSAPAAELPPPPVGEAAQPEAQV